MRIDWNDIDTVLLDMDGTLLDRNFDDHFWLEHVPRRWAARHEVPLADARKQLFALYKSQENTLNWTDLDYWSNRLGLDIPLLKEEVRHLIAVHPFVIDFLLFLRHRGKQVWLVTNAHSKTLSLKLRVTPIGPYFDGVVSAHQVGLPKEDDRFWDALQRFVSYDPARTMLGEDSETNLATARRYGIRYLIHICRFSSALQSHPSDQFPSVDYFNRLVPDGHGTVVTIDGEQPSLSGPESACP